MARLIAIFLIIAAAGVLLRSRAAAGSLAPGLHPSAVPLYLSLIASEWLLFRAVAKGLRSRGLSWRALIGCPASGWSGLASDTLIGALVCAGYVSLVLAARDVSGRPAVEASMLPRGAFEVALWIVLSLSAGFCEEIAFRGYFQAQFAALTQSKGAALILQAVLFGVCHAYQGPSSVALIAAYGALFGALALWRRSLRPSMLGHAMTDLILGLALLPR